MGEKSNISKTLRQLSITLVIKLIIFLNVIVLESLYSFKTIIVLIISIYVKSHNNVVLISTVFFFTIYLSVFFSN